MFAVLSLHPVKTSYVDQRLLSTRMAFLKHLKDIFTKDNSEFLQVTREIALDQVSSARTTGSQLLRH